MTAQTPPTTNAPMPFDPGPDDDDQVDENDEEQDQEQDDDDRRLDPDDDDRRLEPLEPLDYDYDASDYYDGDYSGYDD